MKKLERYIKEKYDGTNYWFVEEIQSIHNQQLVQDVWIKKEYLNGNHKILQRSSYKYNGKEFNPRKIVLQYAKTLINFQKAYLLQNPLTLTGNEGIIKEYQRVNRKGKYDRLNLKLLDKILKYGRVAEYVYMDKSVIKSKLIDPSEGYPVYDENNELLAFIESFVCDGISYYVVYEEDVVSKYDNAGGDMRLVERFANLSGLPIVYHNDNEMSDVEGRSELDDWISILDSMEDLISKYTDSFYKFIDPIFVTQGQQLKGESMPSEVVGKGINLDDGADAKFLSNQLDYKSFETIYKTLLQSLLDVSQTPAVSMNKTDISNLSEVSIKLLFQLANIKAGMNEQFIREGLEERFEKIRTLLGYKGIKFNDDEFETIDVVFQYATPSNDKEIIENLKELREMGAISLIGVLEDSPYTSDVQFELDRIVKEGSSVGNNKDTSKDNKE
ncbi:hypothetical protein HMPREF1013_00665 [Bacillus sp. 2_A_57_CT2]|nr:hypothetical protein HMPREF1013_00665 [Bacillus sp. 2_A_57_CT2]